jgi:hypothetical protein
VDPSMRTIVPESGHNLHKPTHPQTKLGRGYLGFGPTELRSFGISRLHGLIPETMLTCRTGEVGRGPKGSQLAQHPLDGKIPEDFFLLEYL